VTAPIDPEVPPPRYGLASPRSGPRGLGRRYAPDPRDRKYILTPERLNEIPRQLEPGVRRRTVPWRRGPVLDQGATSECTVFAAATFLQCAPQLHAKGLGWERGRFTEYYNRAQQQDEWPGEDYDGTSERAVQKILQEAGFISEYLWVTEEEIAREYLLTRGPLLFGIDWFSGMSTPSEKGAYIEPDGRKDGGHEICVRWYYHSRHYKYPDTYELIQTWGEEEGEQGIVRLKADGFRYLFLQLNGDLCSPQEAKRARR
jgi:hypothetical protein